MMLGKESRAAITVALLVACGAALAQSGVVRPRYDFPDARPEGGPAAIRLGDSPFFVAPFASLAIGYDDNLLLAPANERDSTLYILSPGFVMDAREASRVLQVSYQGAIGRYADSGEDDYDDHTMRVTLDAALAPSHALRLGYELVRGHDPRGSTDRPIGDRPDEYDLRTPHVLYAFGARGAQGRIETYYSKPERRYRNNRDFTFASDRDNEEFGAAFYWRVMPRTLAIFEARRTNISYLFPGSLLNSEEVRYYGGVTWEATAATSGTVKVGSLRKKFHDLPKFSGASWEALVSWSPRTYSRFDFYTTRQPVETSGLGTFILSDAAGVNWNHAWSSFVSTVVSVRFQNDEYKGFDREDDIRVLGAKVSYRFRRWLSLGAEYTRTQRDSNVGAAEYDKNLFLLTAAITL